MKEKDGFFMLKCAKKISTYKGNFVLLTLFEEGESVGGETFNPKGHIKYEMCGHAKQKTRK